MPNEKTENTTTKNGICVKCRANLPCGNFAVDVAKNQTSWCNSCRAAAADKWGVDGDLVELTYGLYLVEQAIKSEIRLIVNSRVNLGADPPSASKDLETVIRNLDGVKHHRIPSFLTEIVALYRLDYFSAVGVAPIETPAPTVEV